MARPYLRLARKLRQAGCQARRQGKGSHEIEFSPLTNRTLSVRANLKSQKLANEILKRAGLLLPGTWNSGARDFAAGVLSDRGTGDRGETGLLTRSRAGMLPVSTA